MLGLCLSEETGFFLMNIKKEYFMKTKQTIVCGIFAIILALIFTACPKFGTGGDEETSGSGTYNGFTYDYDSSSLTITGYNKKISEGVLSIPEEIYGKPVTAIGDKAFQNKGLTGITIGSNVTDIGVRAFYSNELTDIIIPNDVAAIGDKAFSENQLTSAKIGNSVTTIGDDAFSNNQLTSVTIGNSVETIGENAFRNNGLTEITIPNSVKTIYGRAFYENPITSVTIGANVDLNTGNELGDTYTVFPNDRKFDSIYNPNKGAGTYTFYEETETWS